MSNPVIRDFTSVKYTASIASPRSILIVGSKSSAGTATSGVITKIESPSDAQNLLGKTSYALQSVISVLKTGFSNLSVLPLDDATVGSPTPASCTITLSGTAAIENQIIRVEAVNANLGFDINVVIGETPAMIAQAILERFNEISIKPYTVSLTSSTLTLTFTNKGTLGNDAYINVAYKEGLGISVAVSAFSGGAIDPTAPDLSSPSVNPGNVRYTTILWQRGLATTDVVNYLRSQVGAVNEIKDSLLFTPRVGSQGTLSSITSSIDSALVCLFGYKTIDKATEKGVYARTCIDAQVAEFCSLREIRLTEGALLSGIVINPAFPTGGITTASLPYHNTPLKNSPAIKQGSDWSLQERINLSSIGVSTITGNDLYTSVLVNDTVMTRRTTEEGQLLASPVLLNTIDTASVTREFRFYRFKAVFAQSKLSSQPSLADGVIDKSSVELIDNGIFTELVDLGLYENNPTEYQSSREIVIVALAGNISIKTTPSFIGGVREVDLFTTITLNG